MPATNPFVNGGGDPLVCSYGLRNPFRFSFDRLTGDLTIGDVGEGSSEEVDFVPSPGRGLGVNFGWNTCEGMVERVNQSQPCTTGTLPIYAYPNPPMSCAAVTGGVVVRDPSLPALVGKYVFADSCATYLKTLDLPPSPTNETTLPLTVPGGIVGFGEDACGRVHLAHLSASGTVKRLEDDAAPGSCDLTVTYGPPVDEDGAGGGAPGTPVTPGHRTRHARLHHLPRRRAAPAPASQRPRGREAALQPCLLGQGHRHPHAALEGAPGAPAPGAGPPVERRLCDAEAAAHEGRPPAAQARAASAQAGARIAHRAGARLEGHADGPEAPHPPGPLS